MRTLTPIVIGCGLALPIAGVAAESKQPAPAVTQRTSEVRPKGEAEAPDVPIDEVVVTAQRREERLKDVPISIAVLSGATLDGSTAAGMTEILNRVAGVATTVSTQGGGTQVAVRGVTAGDTNFNGSSPIAYYLDAVPFGFVKSAIAPDANTYDLDRVEVLRGPQGTLYGATALNGVVRVLTKDADLDALEFKARTTASSTDGGGGNYRGDVAVNVPIIEDKLAVRAIGGYESSEGWISRPGAHNANSSEARNWRLKVTAQPTQKLSVGMSAWRSDSDADAPAISPDGRTSPAVFDEPVAVEYDVYGLKLEYEFDSFVAVSTTGYLDYGSISQLDFNALGLNDVLVTRFDSKILTEEVNLTSTMAGAWRWSVGAIYRKGEDRLFQNLPSALPAPIDFYDESESFAVYGQLTRMFLDGRVELSGGLRYFEDDVKDGENVQSSGVSTDPLYRAEASFNRSSPRLTLTWRATDDVTLYSSYAEGFRSGFNQNANARTVPPLRADNLKNYEIGSKGALFGGRVNYDAAVYYIDWQNVQQTIGVLPPGGVQPVTALINGASASGTGVDLSIAFGAFAGVQLGLNGSWNDLTMDRDVFSSGTRLFARGDRLNLSPEYTAGAFADYEFSLGASGFIGILSASANYTSKQSNRIETGGTLLAASGDPIWISRASLALSTERSWTATVFVDNINNEHDAVTANAFTSSWNTRVRPRTAGVQVDYRF